MLALYGKLRRLMSKAFGPKDITTLSDDELLAHLEENNLDGITTLGVMGTDYAAVGGTAARLRKIIDDTPLPVIIIVETEAVLNSKRPANMNVVIVVEKSKKADVLKKAIEKYISWDLGDIGVQLVHDEEDSDDITEGNALIITGVNGRAEPTAQTDTELPEPIIESESEPLEETGSAAEPQIVYVDKPVPVYTPVPTPMPLFAYEYKRLPRYAPMIFDSPEEILDHLRGKWGLSAESR